MRRFLFAIVLLALVLGGTGLGMAAGAPATCRDCSASCPMLEQAQAGQASGCPGSRPCVAGKPGPAVPAQASSRLAPSADPSAPGGDPAPWPIALVRTRGGSLEPAPSAFGRLRRAALPAAYPGPLAWTCVLRI